MDPLPPYTYHEFVQRQVDERFDVQEVRYTMAVQKAQLSIEEMASTFRNHMLMHLQAFVLTEHLYDRDVKLSIDRKVRPRWIPEFIWRRIPTETVSREHRFTVDRLYPDANPDLGASTIKERVISDKLKSTPVTWTT